MDLDVTHAWQTVEPRMWQEDALDAISHALGRDKRAVVQAVMGSGKSYLIAELCALCEGTVVVTAPTRTLVRQLTATINRRLEAFGETAGQYFTDQKNICRVTVVCHASLGTFADDVEWGTDLWVSDEAHRTENDQVKEPIEYIKPEARVGFTATPYLSQASRSITHFDTLIYRYLAGDALRDSVVVPWLIENHSSRHGRTVDESCLSWLREAVHKRGVNRILCDSLSIQDSEAWANTLRQNGIQAQTVHSGLSASIATERIEQLKARELDVIVHVQMLREGVNLPWLRALVLRAPCSSRVGFAQHVGRALRAHPEKTNALIYDPQDLFSTHKLTYEAALGEVECEDVSDVSEVIERLSQKRGRRSHGVVRVAEEVDDLHQILRQLYVAADACGSLPDRRANARNCGRISKRQIRLILTKGHRLSRNRSTLPEVVRRALRQVWFGVPVLDRSAANDLIEIMNMLLSKGGWPEHGSSLIR